MKALEFGPRLKVKRWLVAMTVLPLMGWWLTGLFDLDEGFYGAVVREMLWRNDYITPFYNGRPWFEKPILLYWLAAPCVAVFGEVIGPRLPSVLTTLGLYGVVYWFVRRHVNEWAAWWSVALLSGSLLIVGAGRMMLTDPPYVLALTASLVCFYESLVKPSPKMRIAAAALLGVAVLGKGPVAGALFIMIFAIFLGREKAMRTHLKGGWLLGVLAFCAVVSLWYVPAYLANGQFFIDKFLIEQNVGRASGGDQAHSYGGWINWIYYAVVLLISGLPWAFKIFWVRSKGMREPTQLLMRFCWIWLGVVFGLFTLSAAKLPHYILPAVAPMAILIGIQVTQWHEGRRAMGEWNGFGSLIIGRAVLALLVNLVIFEYYSGGQNIGSWTGKKDAYGGHAELHQLVRNVRKDQSEVAVFQMSRRESDRGTGSLRIRETSHPSIVFYLGRTVRQADTADELLSPEPVGLVLTRTSRITPELRSELSAKGFHLEPLGPQGGYAAFRLLRVR